MSIALEQRDPIYFQVGAVICGPLVGVLSHYLLEPVHVQLIWLRYPSIQILSGLIAGGVAASLAPNSKNQFLLYFMIPAALLAAVYGFLVMLFAGAFAPIPGLLIYLPGVAACALAIWLWPTAPAMRFGITGTFIALTIAGNIWASSPAQVEFREKRYALWDSHLYGTRRGEVLKKINSRLAELSNGKLQLKVVPNSTPPKIENLDIVGALHGGVAVLDNSKEEVDIYFPQLEGAVDQPVKIPAEMLEKTCGLDAEFLKANFSSFLENTYFVKVDRSNVGIRLNVSRSGGMYETVVSINSYP
jgi:hypothetical protein